ncbi:MAG: NAD(P)H-dependent flavin oxidoreductase [Hyphomicrobiaceae bacterium]
MRSIEPPLKRCDAFCEAYGLRIPILLAPMAGACPPSLSVAVGNAGGMGACGVLLMQPDAIGQWARDYRAGSNGSFMLNNWIPDPAPDRDVAHESAVRDFLGTWGPEVFPEAADRKPPDFAAQCEAMINARPQIISSIMGLYPAEFVDRMKEADIKWFATVTTVEEAIQAEAAGADVVVAQGMEAGGHRGAFEANRAADRLVGLFALVPAVADSVQVPVVAAGGIADARGITSALMLGASAVMIGTGLLRSPEAKIPQAWADAIGQAQPDDTIATRAFSGRLGRSIRTAYAVAANDQDAPAPAPYPVQRALTQAMRDEANKAGDIDRMQAWAGQSARLSRAAPADQLVTELWEQAEELLGRVR